jgi:isoleucyl-tRNA synthetase
MFQPVPANVSFPKLEEEVLQFWKERRIYEKSLANRRGAPAFVFYEGPPTANGKPHPGHCLTRAIKDLFPRYKTMRGYLCERKAGWDTHGLPVEVEVSKELGIHAKEEIEQYGMEPFIIKCQESVWRYMQEWERLTERLGFWIKLDEAYVTYHQSYIESVWWSLKNLFDRGLLYQGHKIVWWWAQGGTALSSGEVGQGYREVADPSVYVEFPLIDRPNASLLVWTTTPWTLPSNQFAAVHPELDYATVIDSETNELVIVAATLVESLAAKFKREFKVDSTCKGSELIGLRYKPPFDCYYSQFNNAFDETLRHSQWEVVEADFVTTDSGTGVVHLAPAFGEVDYDVLTRIQSKYANASEGPELICSVAPDGKFTDEGPEYCRGRWVKDCDRDITRDLKTRGLLYHQEQYVHDYPFCWRAEEDPLIQYPRKSWFIKTTAFKDEMLANNEQINWLPEHIKHGRFGNFLESNVDWALSRERFWGTPLPIWVCQQTGKMEAIGSYAELLAKPGVKGIEAWEKAKATHANLVEDLKVHKPYIDEITYDSPFAAGAHMRRVPEVIDCWYDSGAMPFAQWGYPHTGQEKFQSQFPADFISEALDQTRGWFYSQLAISTLLFGKGSGDRRQGTESLNQQSAISNQPYPHPFRNCIVLGLMLGEDGQKMSKSKRNYREPAEIFDKYGADALRWFFFAVQPPWTTIRYREQAIKDSIPEFLLRLWNCYTFFVIYANIDGFDPATSKARPASQRSELDRWILSELNRTAAAVVERMDQYDNFEACKRINEFVDGLSNWYVRRSRDRFWASEKDSPEKLDAYWTLYECLTTSAKLIAPFVPFLAETLWQNLAQCGPHAPREESESGNDANSGAAFVSRSETATMESVHLCDYPTGDASVVDEALSQQMRTLREIASLGRAARMDNKLKVRQPLASVHVILSDTTHQAWLEEHDALLRDELNVKQIDYIREAEKYITYQVQPNFKRLGPRVGKLLPGLKAELGKADGGKLLSQLSASGKVTLKVGSETVELDSEDIQVRLQAKPGWAAAQGSGVVVVLNTELTPELIAEGYAKDFIRLVQDRRKALELAYTDHILLGVVTDSAELKTAIQANLEHILGETLADSLVFEALPGVERQEVGVGDCQAVLYVKKVS